MLDTYMYCYILIFFYYIFRALSFYFTEMENNGKNIIEGSTQPIAHHDFNTFFTLPTHPGAGSSQQAGAGKTMKSNPREASPLHEMPYILSSSETEPTEESSGDSAPTRRSRSRSQSHHSHHSREVRAGPRPRPGARISVQTDTAFQQEWNQLRSSLHMEPSVTRAPAAQVLPTGMHMHEMAPRRSVHIGHSMRYDNPRQIEAGRASFSGYTDSRDPYFQYSRDFYTEERGRMAIREVAAWRQRAQEAEAAVDKAAEHLEDMATSVSRTGRFIQGLKRRFGKRH